MSLRIQTNVAALNAHRQLTISDRGLSKSMERLSSGYRINRASDDAAGLVMSKKFVAQIKSLTVASRNASQANSLLQVAEGGMNQIGNMLTRLKELATQAASANSEANLSDINNEATAVINEIDRIANATTFQGTKLLTGYGTKTASESITVDNAYDLNVDNASEGNFSITYTGGTGTIEIKHLETSVSQSLTAAGGATTYNFGTIGISFKTTGADAQSTILAAVQGDLDDLSVATSSSDFQVGDENDTNHRISFQLDSVLSSDLSVDTGTIALDTIGNAQSALDKIDNAISALGTSQAEVGALMNRLGYTTSNLATTIENASAANSVVRDVDMAYEMTTFTKYQILQQAGTAMLAQANMAPQSVLSLFGG